MILPYSLHVILKDADFLFNVPAVTLIVGAPAAAATATKGMETLEAYVVPPGVSTKLFVLLTVQEVASLMNRFTYAVTFVG